jgi:hypothetical protein
LSGVNPDPAAIHCVVCNTDPANPWALFALIISFVVLIVQVSSFFLTNFFNRRRDQSAKVDEAWFKAIVLDDCLPELQKYAANQRAKFEELARGNNQTVAQHVQFMRQFNSESESLQRKLAMTECMSVKAMQATVLEVEQLEDVVATNASKVLDAGNTAEMREAALLSATQEFDKRSANCLLIWKRLHHALQNGKDPEK